MATQVTWVTWTAKGRDRYYNPKAGRSHATVNGDLASVGDFPLLCGRHAPDAFDATIRSASGQRRCAACQKAVAKLVPATVPVSNGTCSGRLGCTPERHDIFCPQFTHVTPAPRPCPDSVPGTWGTSGRCIHALGHAGYHESAEGSIWRGSYLAKKEVR